MRYRIRDPLRLIAILFLFALAAGDCFWILDYVSVYRPEGDISYLPIAHDRPPPNDEELADAMAIVREAGWMREIAGDQQWTPTRRELVREARWIAIPNAKELGIRFTVVWEQPVESDGPWQSGQCRLTRLIRGFSTVTNIRAVRAIVDMDRRMPLTRVAVSPIEARESGSSFNGPEFSSNPQHHGIPPGREKIVITDAIAGEAIYEGHYKDIPKSLRKCPSDLDDGFQY